ncbi:uncharacterized protein BBA_01371 [Beauveria bassiana ARSEF 2860]|uniref:Uncharacterized protein n=1 Tax=Beauveria bassiana (strain ARSEF 2860) TaxID=655819 RepID=J5K5Q6_BEAB2|nr:uncharacterized protein BBA_01371 [Beauveria bassiana ARSEF 2860]EJP69406.1 hypothetical protein BBA_01371 [Beauveria bassiana ARSEF 2860]
MVSLLPAMPLVGAAPPRPASQNMRGGGPPAAIDNLAAAWAKKTKRGDRLRNGHMAHGWAPLHVRNGANRTAFLSSVRITDYSLGGPDDAAVGLRLRRECNHEAYPQVAVGERAFFFSLLQGIKGEKNAPTGRQFTNMVQKGSNWTEPAYSSRMEISLQPSFIIILLGLSRTNRVSDACISLQSLDLFINANM